jgi:hypothetical protein
LSHAPEVIPDRINRSAAVSDRVIGVWWRPCPRVGRLMDNRAEAGVVASKTSESFLSKVECMIGRGWIGGVGGTRGSSYGGS